MAQPSREALLEMLTGEGYSGGARSRKKVPKGLKSWIAFRKKHPGMSIKQQSKLYKKQGGALSEGEGDMEGGAESEYEMVMEGGKLRRRKKRRGTRKRRTRKGRGIDGEDDIEGGAGPSAIKTGSENWKTKYLKEAEAYLRIGEVVFKAVKKAFPKEYMKAKKTAVGYGVSFQDYVAFAKKNNDKFGIELRDTWDANFKPVDGDLAATLEKLKIYFTPKEVALIKLGLTAKPLALADDFIKAYEGVSE